MVRLVVVWLCLIFLVWRFFPGLFVGAVTCAFTCFLLGALLVVLAVVLAGGLRLVVRDFGIMVGVTWLC